MDSRRWKFISSSEGKLFETLTGDIYLKPKFHWPIVTYQKIFMKKALVVASIPSFPVKLGQDFTGGVHPVKGCDSVVAPLDKASLIGPTERGLGYK